MLALKLNNHGVNNKYLKEANVKTTDALHVSHSKILLYEIVQFQCNARQLPPPGVEFAGGLKAEANRDTVRI